MPKREPTALELALKEERLAAYARVRGGYSVPLAGTVFWLGLGGLGYFTDIVGWVKIAFPATGLIFPLAIFFGWALKNPWLKDKNATMSLLPPVMISMLLFWVFIVAAIKEAPALIPLILAVGMSFHWPAIGWSYGRSALFTAHAVVRALACLYIFMAYPDHRLTWLPFSVAAVYLATVIAIYVDSGLVARRLAR
ncbi:MAG: hypothetical protein U5J99_11045 [Parvularculaceae bacterium]|nr:hypothetical protein [Parvularculaceae bacterium]